MTFSLYFSISIASHIGAGSMALFMQAIEGLHPTNAYAA
jgi:hypothetical protein